MAQFFIVLFLVYSFGYQTRGMAEARAEENFHKQIGLLLDRIQNLENRIDIDMKIMKKELKREINNGGRRRKCERKGTHQLQQEIQNLQTTMQEILDRLESNSQRQNNVTESVMNAVSSISSDVKTLSTSVNSIQRQLGNTDARIMNLTSTVDDIHFRIERLPLTQEITSEYTDFTTNVNTTESPFLTSGYTDFTTSDYLLNQTSLPSDTPDDITMTPQASTQTVTYDDYYAYPDYEYYYSEEGNKDTGGPTKLLTPTQTSTQTSAQTSIQTTQTSVQTASQPSAQTTPLINESTTVGVTNDSTTQQAISLRLVDGLGPWEGRLEVNYQGEWGTVCDDSWDDFDAVVVCRMLGYADGKAFARAIFGQGTGRILMESISCSGNETSLFNCDFGGWVNHDCSHREDAGVRCVPDIHVNSVRLVGGDSHNVGRVEITVNNATGSICDDQFDFKAATVLCKMMGFRNGGESFTEAIYGEGSGPVIFDDVICKGNEETIVDCQYRQPFTSNCGHDEDISVRCFLNDTLVKIPPVILEEPSKVLYFSSAPVELPCVAVGVPEPRYRWTFNGEHFNVSDSERVTQSSTDGTLMFNGLGPRHVGYYQCFADNDYGVAVSVKTNLRQAVLFDSNEENYLEHRVVPGSLLRIECNPPHSDPPAEIYWEIQGPSYDWEPLSHDETMTVSFEDGSLLILGVNYRSEMDDRALACVVKNTFLNESARGTQHFIIVTDAPEQKKTPTIFWPEPGVWGMPSTVSKTVLIGGELKHLCVFDGNPIPKVFWEKLGGRSKIPEKAVYEDWGRILKIGNFTQQDAGEYECGAVNEDGASSVGQKFAVTAEAVPYWIEKPKSVNAVIGDDTTFICFAGGIPEPTYTWTINGLPLIDFLPIPTSPTPATATGVRLVGGRKPTEGRVEVWYSGQWNTVCDDNWDTHDAKVVCRMLGHSGGIAVKEARYGRGSGPIAMDDVNCNGRESSLFDCRFNGWYNMDCSHDEDAGVSCLPAPTTTFSPTTTSSHIGSSAGVSSIPLSQRISRPDNTTLFVRDLALDDHMNIQCNATNKHGYVFADVYLNVDYSKP